jgi:hypothetical protein
MSFKLQCKKCRRVVKGGSCWDHFCYQRMYRVPHSHCPCGGVLHLEDMDIIKTDIGY